MKRYEQEMLTQMENSQGDKRNEAARVVNRHRKLMNTDDLQL